MKKIMIIAMLCAVSVQLDAQDTIWRGQRVPNYYYWDTNWYDWYVTHFQSPCVAPIVTQGMFNGYMAKNIRGQYEEARYIYTERPLKIIGIAATTNLGTNFITFNRVYPDCGPLDSSFYFKEIPEYLKMYEVDGDSMIELASVRWDTLQPRFYMPAVWMRPDSLVERRIALGNCLESWRWEYYIHLPTFEVYFDEPIVVTDSFYVSGTLYHNYMLIRDTTDSVTLNIQENEMRYAHPHFEYLGMFDRTYKNIEVCNPDTLLFKPNPNHKRYRYHSFDLLHTLNNEHTYYAKIVDTLWHYGTADYFLHIFPIFDTTQEVVPRDTCPTPAGFRVVDADRRAAILSWLHTDGVEQWEMRITNDRDPDAEVVVRYLDTLVVLTRLVPDTWYTACVRSVCADSVSDGIYSAWSDSMTFYIPQDGESVAGVERGVALNLVPNPAKESVQVTATGVMEGIVLYTLQGQKLYGMRCSSDTATLTLDGLSAGVYIVEVTLADKVKVRKKLLVE